MGEDRKTEEVGRVRGIIEAYTKVPTPSGLIDKTVKIVKITFYLLNFPSQSSHSHIFITDVPSSASYFFLFMHPEDNIQLLTNEALDMM